MKKVVPGHIISRKLKTGNYLYYREHKSRETKSTGLIDNPNNRKKVEKILEKAYYDQLEQKGKVIIEIDRGKDHIYYLSDMIEEYLNSLKTTKSLNYQSGIKTSFKHLFSNVDFDINQKVKTQQGKQKVVLYKLEVHFRDVYLEFRKEKKSNNILRNCQRFYNWLSDNSYLESYIKITKYKVKETPKPIRTYDVNEVEKILEYLKEKNYELYLLFSFMYYTGTRISETLRIEIKDIDLKERIIYIPNKIKTTEIEKLYLSDDAIKIINELLIIANKRANNKHKLFKWVDVSRSRITRNLSNAMLELGLKYDGNATHIFRKSFITKQSEQSNINIIQFKHLSRIKDLKTAEKSYANKNRDLLVSLLNQK